MDKITEEMMDKLLCAIPDFNDITIKGRWKEAGLVEQPDYLAEARKQMIRLKTCDFTNGKTACIAEKAEELYEKHIKEQSDYKKMWEELRGMLDKPSRDLTATSIIRNYIDEIERGDRD